ncbi:hypothetical protein HDU76_007032 [Blyttiomyces sp. JEL0837]|nr:hypothetical protein HDU76_007032 [Blyttiomyces sp. JEL0837]
MHQQEDWEWCFDDGNVDPDFDYVREFRKWTEYAVAMDNFLFHIPLDQGWLDELAHLKVDEMKLFVFAGSHGHVKLFNKLWPKAKKKLGVGFLGNVMHSLAEMLAEWNLADIFKKFTDEGIKEFSIDKATDAACSCGSWDMVKRIVEIEPICAEDAFLAAAKAGEIQLVKFLLHVADGDPRVRLDFKAIIGSCINQHSELFKLLINRLGVDVTAEALIQMPGVSASAQGNTPICNAITFRWCWLKFLLTINGVDATAQQNYALRRAAACGHVKLQVPGVDVTANDNEAIRKASSYGRIDIVKILLQNDRVDPAANDHEAVIEASRNGHLEVVQLLLGDQRVDASAQNNTAI